MSSTIDDVAYFNKELAYKELTERASLQVEKLSAYLENVYMHTTNNSRTEIFSGYDYIEAYELLTIKSETLNSMLEGIMKGKEFPICSLSKADLEERGFDTTNLTDEQLKQLANRLGETYVRQSFWNTLDQLATEYGIPRKN